MTDFALNDQPIYKIGDERAIDVIRAACPEQAPVTLAGQGMPQIDVMIAQRSPDGSMFVIQSEDACNDVGYGHGPFVFAEYANYEQAQKLALSIRRVIAAPFN